LDIITIRSHHDGRALVTQAADIDRHIVDLPDAGKRSAKRILFLFENSFSESVEQSTEFLTERAKDSESKGMKVGSPPTFFDVILQHHYPSPVAYNFVIIQLELYIEVHINCRSAQK
jgi:hypothetical protein